MVKESNFIGTLLQVQGTNLQPKDQAIMSTGINSERFQLLPEKNDLSVWHSTQLWISARFFEGPLYLYNMTLFCAVSSLHC